MNKKRVYLDHASTTPLDPRVFRAMKPFLSGGFANPSALYEEGVEAKRNLMELRERVAIVLHARSDEIVFTGSGTEADNLALLGVFEKANREINRPHFVTSAFEHPAILETFKYIETRGGEVTYLSPSKSGFVSSEEVRDALKKNTVLVSIMYAQNEVGTIQPIREIAKVIRQYKKRNDKQVLYFHTDASQAANYCNLNILELGVDLLTLDGSKIYGPKSVGALFIRRGVKLLPLIRGGGQERGMRSGTESLALIAGFTRALEISQKEKEKESERLREFQKFAIKYISSKFTKATLNGSLEDRLPNNLNVCFPGLDSEFAVIKLDALGFSISSSSSCNTLSESGRSHVLESMGGKKCAESSLRITFGRSTQKSDIKNFLRALGKAISKK